MADRAVAIIPARYGSTRFPGKMLADQTGKPLIQHVYERASRAESLGRIIVATDDARIFQTVKNCGGEAVMTREDHLNGTSRIAEAVEKLGVAAELIVNVQGDEPEIDPAVIDLAVTTLAKAGDCVVSTIASPFTNDEDPANPNIVKVVVDQAGRALYFSRASIPFDRDRTATVTPLKHVGLYVYRRAFLPVYVSLTPTPLEESEKLEQLRVLEHGHRIAVAITATSHHGIDTPEQYQAFVARACSDNKSVF